jgi:HlyD family secretion protein
VVLTLSGCHRGQDPYWQGYIEGEFVRVASPLSGALESLAVQRGEQVTSNQALFSLECSAEEASLRETTERLRQNRSRLDDLAKGSRPTELAAIDARLAQAKADAELAGKELERATRLLLEGAVAQSEQDAARTWRESALERVAEIESELKTARLGGREDALRAAQAEVDAAEAAVSRAAWSVEQKRQVAPAAALVHDTLYRPGEWVAAGNPVVSLLPPTNLKVRFFVPEPELGGLRVGETLEATIDGLSAPQLVRISYVAPQVEFTPPVIYSQENQAKLVTMVEAIFEQPDPAQLHPGQPVAVRRRASDARPD